MDPSPLQRRAVFALVVFLLAGLGSYLFLPGVTGASQAHDAARHAGDRSGRPGRSGRAGPSASAAPSPSRPSPAAVRPVPGQASPAPDIYQWLPFSQEDLAKAAAVVTAFGRDYETYSYTEDAASYVGAMRGLITGELSQVLAAGYDTPGVASLRASRKEVSAGAARINSLRAFGPSSITFVATLTQVLTGTGGRTTTSGVYAITVTASAGRWQVSDIELASAGNS